MLIMIFKKNKINNNNYKRVESSKCLARMTSGSYTTQEHV